MGADFLRPGAETVVMSVDNSADLFTAVVEEQSDGAVRFEWAEGEGPVFPPRQGALVRLLEGAGTGRAYSWDAEVRERGGNHLLCDLVGQPQPYERRGYKRVRTMLPLRFSIQSPQTGPADVMQRLERLEKTVQRIAKHVGIPDPLGERPVGLREVCELSLSGGGAGLILDYHMTIGERLELDLELPLHPVAQVRTRLQVVRCDPGLSQDGSPRWVAGGRFEGITNGDRAAIVRYTAQRERELARTGTPPPR